VRKYSIRTMETDPLLVVVTELQRHINGFRNPTMEYKSASQGAASFLVAALDPALDGKLFMASSRLL
jgi:hypothetical protein